LIAIGGARLNSRVAALMVIALLLTAALPAAADAGRPASALPRGLAAAGLEPCPPGGEVDGSGMCTHGTDPMPDTIRARGVPRPVAGQSVGATAVGCDGDGSSGRRVQAIYAYVAGRLNRKSAYLDSFRTWAANVDAMFEQSALETGGNRRLRWVTNARCLLNVPAVALSADAEITFGTMVNELAAKGYDRDDRKYLVWFDSDPSRSSICGVAGVWLDDRPTADNANNRLRGYARVDSVCWNFAEQHELMHTLGAVQGSAPNHSAALHCTDEYDQMCYADGAGVVLHYVCPARFERLFDCNHDDYFSTDPVGGSYLAEHWNTANSGWLMGAPNPPPGNDAFANAIVLSGLSGTASGSNESATAEPDEPANGSSSSPINSVWYSWTPHEGGTAFIDTCGSGFDTTVAAYVGEALVTLSQLAANDDDPLGACGHQSRIQFAASAGTTYRLSVDGSGPATGSFSLSYRLQSGSADLEPPLVAAPSVDLVTGQRIGSTVLLHASWPEAVDASGIAAYELQRRKDGGGWATVPLLDPTAAAADMAVSPGATYELRLRATDGAGNTGPWVASAAGDLRLLQETDPSIGYGGKFKRVSLRGSSGGKVRKTGAAGRTASLSFNGRSVGFVTTFGTQRGIVEVRLDGGPWQSIDLYASSLSTRRVAWTATAGAGNHTLEVRITGTANAAAAKARVDVDAFVIW